MTCNEVSLFDIIGRTDRFVAESQVRNGHAAGLLGVILEVCLCLHVGMVTDDLDGVLIRANGAIRAQTPELASLGSLRCNVRILGAVDGKVGHIVCDGNREFLLRCIAPQVFVYGQHIARLYVLGAQTVTTAADQAAFEFRAAQCGDDV